MIDSSDLKKAREVIYQMGLEDETITQKPKYLELILIKKTKTKRKGRKGNSF